MKTKVIVNYLPQYHVIKQNDEWWGEGYTDWVAVKKAKSLYEGHVQPKSPKDNNYYSLDDLDTIRWQAELAKKNGIYGFGIYHYWFSDDLCLLDKPANLLYENKDIRINYLFIWDNATWRRTWTAVKGPSNSWAPQFDKKTSEGNGILAELVYGGKESWKKHFYYLLNFFKDERYIKVNNKPLFAIFNTDNNMNLIKEMCDYWSTLALENGFDGMLFIGKYKGLKYDFLDYRYYYQPEWDGWKNTLLINRAMDYLRKRRGKANKPVLYSYDKIWRKIIKNAKKTDSRCMLSGFVEYDDTPRRGVMGRVIEKGNPEKFGFYFEKLYRTAMAKKQEFVFLTAWNEWGEGAYLEPDSENGFAYLNELKRILR